MNIWIANQAALKGDGAVVVISRGDAVVVQWSRRGIGFGEITFYEDEDGNLAVDTEGMGATFCLEVLRKLASPESPPGAQP